MLRLLNIGYGNVGGGRPGGGGGEPRLGADEAAQGRRPRARGKLVDATQGRRTRSILVTDTDHVILSALSSETIAERLETGKSE